MLDFSSASASLDALNSNSTRNMLSGWNPSGLELESTLGATDLSTQHSQLPSGDVSIELSAMQDTAIVVDDLDLANFQIYHFPQLNGSSSEGAAIFGNGVLVSDTAAVEGSDELTGGYTGAFESTTPETEVSSQPLIGVIDTGFDANNPDIEQSRIQLGSDRIDGDNNPLLEADGTSHGTAVLNVIAATQNNGIGIDGVNDAAPVWLSRAVGSGQWAESLVEFVDTAKDSGQPNAIVNLSFDLAQVNADGSVTTRDHLTLSERAALEYARQNDVIVVVAAGNTGEQISALGQAATEFDNIITVGAAAGLDRANYSSYGNGLTLLATGENGEAAGTSIAAAEVTGAASQIWAENAQLSYRQVIDILQATATDLQTPGWDPETGSGLLNLTAALSQSAATLPSSQENSGETVPTLTNHTANANVVERTALFGVHIPIVDDAVDVVSDAADAAADAVGDAAGAAVDTVGDATGAAIDTVGDAAGAAVDTVGNATDALVDTVGDAAGAAVDTVGDATGAVVDAVGDAAGAVGDATGAAIDTVGDAADAVADAIGDGTDWLFDRLGDGANLVLDAVGDGAGWLLDAAGAGSNWLFDAVGLDSVGDGADWLFRTIGDGLDASFDFAGDVANGVIDAVGYGVGKWLAELPSELERLGLDTFDVVGSLIEGDWKGALGAGIGVLFDSLELHGVPELLDTVLSLIDNPQPLTDEQLTTARSVFGDAIDYDEVRIDDSSNLIDVLGYVGRDRGRALTLFDTIYAFEPMLKSTLVHELTHVWQYQHDGAIYAAEAVVGQIEGYDYDVAELQAHRDSGLTAFNREQQAEIVEDYYKIREDGTATQQLDLPLYVDFVEEVSTLSETELLTV